MTNIKSFIVITITSNNQRLWRASDNYRKSKRFCSNVTCDQVSFFPVHFEKENAWSQVSSNAVLCVSFTWQIVKTRLISLRGVEGPYGRDQFKLRTFHSFLVEVQTNAPTYMRRMPNNNLEIRIAGSSCRPQLLLLLLLYLRQYVVLRP